MRVLFRPDLGATIGSGHAMRDLAVAEALVDGGVEVVYACDPTGLAWVEEAITARGCRIVAPTAPLATLADHLGAAAVLVDSYTLPTSEYLAVRDLGRPVLAVVDGHRRGAVADVLIDPSPGPLDIWAEEVARGQRMLLGPPHALVRQEFRGEADREHVEAQPLRVLVAFGGTDALGVAPAMAASVLALDLPVALTVVTRDDLRSEVEGLALRPHQRLRAVAPGTGFPDLVRAHDLVLSAAGSTTWELLAMATATGLVRVADNQERYFRALPDTGATVAVGTHEEVREGSPRVTTALRSLVEDAGLRSTLRRTAADVVDGRGGERVAAEILRLTGPGSSASAGGTG